MGGGVDSRYLIRTHLDWEGSSSWPCVGVGYLLSVPLLQLLQSPSKDVEKGGAESEAWRGRLTDIESLTDCKTAYCTLKRPSSCTQVHRTLTLGNRVSTRPKLSPLKNSPY